MTTTATLKELKVPCTPIAVIAALWSFHFSFHSNLVLFIYNLNPCINCNAYLHINAQIDPIRAQIYSSDWVRLNRFLPNWIEFNFLGGRVG